MSWDVYDRFMTVYGDTECDRAIEQARETFLREAIDHPCYRPNCKRNGKPQRFLVERTDVPYKAKFVTFPTEEIFPGDLIEVENYTYIIIEPPRFVDRINWAAVGRLCNLTLRWQDFDGRICSSPVCLDAGVYSTTLNGTDTVQAPDKQFKLYAPYNEDTAKLYLDKRIAVDRRYDKHGNQILECYRITGTNRVAKTYGTGGHLLICELRSSNYSPEHDNTDELICDYVTPPKQDDGAPNAASCTIKGRKSIRIGHTQRYTVERTDNDGQTIDVNSPIWTYGGDTKYATMTPIQDHGAVDLSILKDEDAVGAIIRISATIDNGASYSTLEVEVIG